jgi:hypothetical protein
MGTAVVIPQPRRAEKKRVKLKMAVQGPSGSGKTWGALALAKNLWPEAKICLIDTENESASLYADRFDFDTIPLSPPFTTARYVACIDVAVKAGYDVLIIDSITAQWDGEGGILRRKEEMDKRPGSNGYANWASFTPEHEAFKQIILQCPMHVIATMRSKQDYILVANDKGKQVPKKVGMAPIQRDQIDYEFTLVFDVEMDHKGAATKDRTGLFNEKIVDLADPKTAEAIKGWLATGAESVIPKPADPIPFPGRPTVTAKRAGNLLVCDVKDVLEKTTAKGKPYLFVAFAGRIEEWNGAFCFHDGLFELIRTTKGKNCQFEIEERDKRLSIDTILDIAGQEYRDGKPFNPDAEPDLASATANPEITDADLPATLFQD